MKDCHLEYDSTFMFLVQKIGVVYFKQSDFLNAVDFTTVSIRIAKICLKSHNTDNLSLVDGYYNLQYYYGLLNKVEKKYDAIDSCIAYSLKGSTGFEKSIYLLRDKTNYLFNKGEYSFCIRDARMGIDIIEKYCHTKDSIANIVSFTTDMVNALIFSKDTVTALQLLNKQKTEFEQTKNTKYLGGVFSFLGNINMGKKNYDKALSYFQKAYHSFTILDYKSGCAENLANIGILYAKFFKQQDKGLKYCATALKYSDAADSLFILKETGNIYVQKKLFDKAQNFFQQAFNTIQPNINESGILLNSFPFPGFNILQILLELITEKGDAYLQEYYHTKNIIFLNSAINIYKKADRFLAKIKADQQLQLESNLVWRGTAHNLYEHAIEACCTKKDLESAFYFFEKSRSILLNDQINEQRWMADDDIAKQAQLKKTIIELEMNLSNLPSSSKESSTIQKKLYSTGQELNILLRNIKNKSPLFYHDYLDTSFITIQLVKKNILDNSKSLLEIFAGSNAVYILIITLNDQTLTKINKQSYDSLTNAFNSFLTNPDRLNKHFSDYIRTAHHLYSLLFQNNKPPYGSIIISPDGVSYPFEALAMNENYQQPDYFLNHYATSYTYSLKYLTNQFAANTNTRKSVLGIAPVKYKNYRDLGELPGSDNSLEKINNYFSNATNYVLEKATKNNFLQNFPRYNIIQLYTHAADSSFNNDPVIYFSDSAFYLSELITDHKPITQLVVLSACETGNGKLYEGEGIFSFNRGFAALGIPAAVSNLWSVDNESTYRITESFYKYLSKGFPTDIALQKAKMEFINNSYSKEKKLPYFWAGSVLTGKVNTIKNNPVFPWKGLTIAAISLLCIGIFTRKIILNKRENKPASF